MGNALLARGELEAAALDALRAAAAAAGPGAAAPLPRDAAAAELRARGEASSLLTRAGEMFRGVLEADGWSSRALINWGRAMTGRAALAGGGEAAEKLYGAAIDKFEAVLAEEPGLPVAQYRCALAMRGLAATLAANASAAAGGGGRAAPPREATTLLQDAGNYLRDVVAASAPGGAAVDEGLRAAAAAALAEVEAELEVARRR